LRRIVCIRQAPASEEVLPPEERIVGKHIAEYAKMLEETDPEKYRKVFRKVLERGLDPKELPDHFLHVRDTILGYFKGDEE